MQKNELVEKTINLYKNLGWKSIFAKLRFWDAPFIEVEKLIPKSGTILDLGCGEGLFTNFLALSSSGREILGVDLDKSRIQEADRGVENVKFLYGDATLAQLSKASCIILFHLLHHLNSFKTQEKLLSKCANLLTKNGQLIIVEVEPRFSYKYWLAYFTDHFLVPRLFEKKFHTKIYFRKRNEWVRLLKNYGLSCKVISADKGKPFSHVIFNCQKFN